MRLRLGLRLRLRLGLRLGFREQFLGHLGARRVRVVVRESEWVATNKI